jgi:hypothetical protein
MSKSIFVGLAALAVSVPAASARHDHNYRNSHRTHYSSAYRADRVTPRGAMNNGAYNNGYYRPGYAGSYGPGYARSGFWPADVAGAAVGTAGAIAAGAVNTAGAIATAPFRPANSYAYYPSSNSYAMAPGVSSKEHTQYMKNLHDSGYDPKKDYTAAGAIKTK